MRVRLAVLLALAPTTRAFADGETLLFEVSNDLSPAQPVATVRISAAFDSRDYALQHAIFDIAASEPNWFDVRELLRYIGTTPGIPTRTGDRVNGALVYQYQSPTAGILADPTNPIPVWEGSFEVFDFTPREIQLWTETAAFVVYPTNDTHFGESRLGSFVEGAGTIRVIPAPGGGALIAGLCIATSRRGRRRAGRGRPCGLS